MHKTVVLTFDDAVKSHLTVVAPMLKDYGFGATFFICHAWMPDEEFFLTWEEVAEIHQMGFEPPGPGFGGRGEVNRAVHFAGGRLKAAVEGLGRTYSVQMWIYNGMPGDVRPVAGYFFSRGVDGAEDAPGDHLGIGGTAAAGDRLAFFNGNALDELLEGKTRLETKTT